MNKTYHIVTRAEKKSAEVEQLFRITGQMPLPIVNLIESASQVVEPVIHEIEVQTLEMVRGLAYSCQRRPR